MKQSKRILITGASGLLGTRLTELLEQENCEVVHLGRSKGTGPRKRYIWNINANSIEAGAFDGIDAIIHLSGANVAEKRWTEKRKNELIKSRTDSTRLLYQELATRMHTVHTVVCASAIGYYGFEGDRQFTEEDSPGSDFLAQLTKAWEKEADQIATLGIRLVKLRIGVVLSKTEGALAPIAKTVKMNIGAPLGSGRQLISWIHIDDVCNMFIRALNNQSMHGAYNAVAPVPVTNRALTQAVARTLKKPLLLPHVPAFALKLAFGEMANIVLAGSKVSPKKIESTGFHFKYPDVDHALADLL